MRVALYARSSTDRQNALSIQTQLDDCRRAISKRGWTETLTFTDAAQSGATMLRPQMQALLTACQAGEVDIVYTDTLSRVSRNPGDIRTLCEQLTALGIPLVTRVEELTAPPPFGQPLPHPSRD